MKLKRLELRNIRSYKAQEIHFPNGSILLSGEVGAGKTTLLLAIEYAFFGLQPGQRGSSLLTAGEDEGQVILECDIDDESVIIERTLKRSSKTVTQESSALTINGKRDELSVTELKTRILDLLSYPWEFLKKTNLLYRYTVYSPQEEMKEIMLDDAEPRLDILRHIFGIDKYRIIKDNAIIVAARLREESRLLHFEIKDIEDLRTQLNSLKKTLEELEEKIGKKSAFVQQKASEKKAIESSLASLADKVAEGRKLEVESEKTNILLANKIQQFSEQEREIKGMEKKLEESKNTFSDQELQELSMLIAKRTALIDKLHNNLIDMSGKINSLRIKKEDNLKKKDRVFNIKICPTCLQDVSDNHKHIILNEAEKQIIEADNELMAALAGLEEINAVINNEKKELAACNLKKSMLELARLKLEESRAVQLKMQELVKSRDATGGDIKVLNEHLFKLKQSILQFSRFDNLERIKKEELKKSLEEERAAEIELAEVKKERELIINYKWRIEQDISHREKSKERLINILDIEKWLSENFISLVSFIERNIMLRLREEFSTLFNKWFAMLTSDYFFARLDENFTPVITQGEYELDYSFLSGGERTAVALAYRLALNQIVNLVLSMIKTRDILILDEPTDGFSEPQLDKVRDILREIDVQQLIIVSHEPKIEGFVDNIIRIKKEGGYSAADQKP